MTNHKTKKHNTQKHIKQNINKNIKLNMEHKRKHITIKKTKYEKQTTQ